MQDRLRLDADKTAVIYNGIDLEGFAPADATPKFPTIGFLARMCREKGLDTLVEAFIKLVPRVPDARLKLAAPKPRRTATFVNDLKGRLEQAGIANAAEFRPNLTHTEKQQFLRELTVLSVPTRSGEAFGLFVIEALASGVPVVQPNTAAFPELIELTGGGVLHAPGDASSLADALERLLLDPAYAAQLGRSGRETVAARFTSDAMAGNFDRLLQQL